MLVNAYDDHFERRADESYRMTQSGRYADNQDDNRRESRNELRYGRQHDNGFFDEEDRHAHARRIMARENDYRNVRNNGYNEQNARHNYNEQTISHDVRRSNGRNAGYLDERHTERFHGTYTNDDNIQVRSEQGENVELMPDENDRIILCCNIRKKLSPKQPTF